MCKVAARAKDFQQAGRTTRRRIFRRPGRRTRSRRRSGSSAPRAASRPSSFASGGYGRDFFDRPSAEAGSGSRPSKHSNPATARPGVAAIERAHRERIRAVARTRASAHKADLDENAQRVCLRRRVAPCAPSARSADSRHAVGQTIELEIAILPKRAETRIDRIARR